MASNYSFRWPCQQQSSIIIALWVHPLILHQNCKAGATDVNDSQRSTYQDTFDDVLDMGDTTFDKAVRYLMNMKNAFQHCQLPASERDNNTSTEKPDLPSKENEAGQKSYQDLQCKVTNKVSGVQNRVAVKRSHCNANDVGPNPTATRNEKQTLGDTPTEGSPMV